MAVIVDIGEDVPAEDEALVVCVCRVPQLFKQLKPEAFIPQFVGLGPYHHSNQKLIVTDNFKVEVIKRIFNVNELPRDNWDQNFVSDVESLFHSNVRSTYDSLDKLLYSLTLDAVFFLALLFNANNNLDPPHQRFSSCCILTGRKRDMPLVNASGVELTVDGVVRDLFMLENQIPTQVLKHACRRVINNIKMNQEIESLDEEHDKDLGLTMLKFCSDLSPLRDSHNLSKDPESYDHLLDLMYHMVAPLPKPKPQPEPLPFWCIFTCILPWMFCGLVLFIASCIGIPFLCICYIFGFLMVKTIQGTQAVLLKVPLLGAMLPQLKTEFPPWSNFWRSVKGEFCACLTVFLCIPNHIVERMLGIGENSTKSSEYEILTIPSASELHRAGITFKANGFGDISQIEFDDITKEFSLPCIELDVMSQVIIRNLVAYESLIEPDCLIFGRYIEIMSSLVHTAEDAKVLIDNKIIQTQLRADFVAQIFEGMPTTESIGRTTTNPYLQNLEGQLKKIKAKFDAFRTMDLFWNQLRLALITFTIIVVFSPVLMNLLLQLLKSTILADKLKLLCWRYSFLFPLCMSL